MRTGSRRGGAPRGRSGWRAGLVLAAIAVAPPGPAQPSPVSAQAPPGLHLPPRPNWAPGGAALAAALAPLDRAAREARIVVEVARGNVPEGLRALRPVTLEREVAGRRYEVVAFVTPDYLAIGSDTDFLRVPLSPGVAQRVADLAGASLPTPALVDAVWAGAEVRVPPQPIPPSDAMTTVPVFARHDRLVAAALPRPTERGWPLAAGHKKDVVRSAALAERPGRVAIYGWHRPDGAPIQPLYTGHTADWVDYSHGIRLVAHTVRVDGEPRALDGLLADPALAPLVSDEGRVAIPPYPPAPPSPR